tara:strand:+ start:329 stop:475 length:147 start_codon:yes stop_codon:yes gene_type:complete
MTVNKSNSNQIDPEKAKAEGLHGYAALVGFINLSCPNSTTGQIIPSFV